MNHTDVSSGPEPLPKSDISGDLIPPVVARTVERANTMILLARATRQRFGRGDVLSPLESPLESTLRDALDPLLDYLRDDEWSNPMSGGAGLVSAELWQAVASTLRLTAIRRNGPGGLAGLNDAIQRANVAASFFGPALLDFDPADLCEFEETPEGWLVHYDRALYQDIVSIIEHAYLSIWCEVLEAALSGEQRQAFRFAVRLAVLAFERAKVSPRGHVTDTSRRPPPFHHEATAPIQRTGPPARTWASPSQEVLPVVAA